MCQIVFLIWLNVIAADFTTVDLPSKFSNEYSLEM